jgi:hypothetical protein
MIKKEQIHLITNTLLVKGFKPELPEDKDSSVIIPEEIKKQKAANIRYRTGVVVLEGKLDKELLSRFTFKGKPVESLINHTIIFPANLIDVIDFPIEELDIPISIDISHIWAILDTDDELSK